jgi:AcrR family transcriptional regulator
LSTIQLDESVWYAARVAASAAFPAARGADRRRAILTVAYEQIAERGLEGLRFGDVARGAGINNGTLLYYFPSKDALIQGIVSYMLEDFSASVPPHPADAPPLDALAELRRELEDARRRLGGRLGTVYLELLARARRDAKVAAALRQLDTSWAWWLTSILDRGREQGLFRADLDACTVTILMRVLIRGMGLQALLDGPEAIDRAYSAVGDFIETWLAVPANG